MKEHIYSEVAARRRYLGMSQEQVASLAGLRREKVNRIESRREDMSFEDFCRLADAVGLRVELVLKESPDAVSAGGSYVAPSQLKNHDLKPQSFENARFIDGAKSKVLRWGPK